MTTGRNEQEREKIRLDIEYTLSRLADGLGTGSTALAASALFPDEKGCTMSVVSMNVALTMPRATAEEKVALSASLSNTVRHYGKALKCLGKVDDTDPKCPEATRVAIHLGVSSHYSSATILLCGAILERKFASPDAKPH